MRRPTRSNAQGKTGFYSEAHATASKFAISRSVVQQQCLLLQSSSPINEVWGPHRTMEAGLVIAQRSRPVEAAAGVGQGGGHAVLERCLKLVLPLERRANVRLCLMSPKRRCRWFTEWLKLRVEAFSIGRKGAGIGSMGCRPEGWCSDFFCGYFSAHVEDRRPPSLQWRVLAHRFVGVSGLALQLIGDCMWMIARRTDVGVGLSPPRQLPSRDDWELLRFGFAFST